MGGKPLVDKSRQIGIVMTDIENTEQRVRVFCLKQKCFGPICFYETVGPVWKWEVFWTGL